MGRMDGTKSTREIVPTVKCIEKSQFPVSLLSAIWWGSRHKTAYIPDLWANLWFHEGDGSIDVMKYRDKEIDDIVKAYPEYINENSKTPVRDIMTMLTKTILDSDLPPLEAVNFVFEVDNATVAWRDQLVRCRDAGYWVQTSRTMNLSTIDVNRAKSIEMFGGPEAVARYDDTVDYIRRTYEFLQSLGIPGEDIRLAPGAQVHRVYWFVNLRVLIRLIKKRADWIAQGSLWTPILGGIFDTLTNEDPFGEYAVLLEMLRDMACKPAVTIKDGKVVAHHYDIENMDRYTGKDPQPCDPLWLAYHGYKMPDHTDAKFYQYLKEMYINIWPSEYLEVLGWDKTDVNKKGPYDI